MLGSHVKVLQLKKNITKISYHFRTGFCSHGAGSAISARTALGRAAKEAEHRTRADAPESSKESPELPLRIQPASNSPVSLICSIIDKANWTSLKWTEVKLKNILLYILSSFFLRSVGPSAPSSPRRPRRPTRMAPERSPATPFTPRCGATKTLRKSCFHLFSVCKAFKRHLFIHLLTHFLPLPL